MKDQPHKIVKIHC